MTDIRRIYCIGSYEINSKKGVKILNSVGENGIAFFRNGFGQGVVRLVGLDINLVLAAVDDHNRLWVQLFDGVGDRFFAMAAGHASDVECLFHGVSLSVNRPIIQV